jgi:hypothetical protein
LLEININWSNFLKLDLEYIKRWFFQLQ